MAEATRPGVPSPGCSNDRPIMGNGHRSRDANAHGAGARRTRPLAWSPPIASPCERHQRGHRELALRRRPRELGISLPKRRAGLSHATPQISPRPSAPRIAESRTAGITQGLHDHPRSDSREAYWRHRTGAGLRERRVMVESKRWQGASALLCSPDQARDPDR